MHREKRHSLTLSARDMFLHGGMPRLCTPPRGVQREGEIAIGTSTAAGAMVPLRQQLPLRRRHPRRVDKHR